MVKNIFVKHATRTFEKYVLTRPAKSNKKFYKGITISKRQSSNEMLNFSEMEPLEENLENLPDKVIQNNYTLAEDPLNRHRSATNETALVSEISIKTVIIVPGQEKIPLIVSIDYACQEVLFTCLFSKR